MVFEYPVKRLPYPGQGEGEFNVTSNRWIPDEYLLKDLRRVCNKLGKPVTLVEYREHGSYSPTPFGERWESWFDALEMVGWEVDSEHARNSINVTDEKLVKVIQDLAEELEKVPTSREFQNKTNYSRGMIQYRFGSWNNAIEMAGFDPNSQGAGRIEFDFDEIWELYYGELMTTQEIADKFGISKQTILKRMDEMGIFKTKSKIVREIVYKGSVDAERVDKKVMLRWRLEERDGRVYIPD